MKLKREAALLKQAAIDSMIVAIDHFNRTIGPARLEASVIFAQRAFEMLLKAAILQETGRIRDKGEKRWPLSPVQLADRVGIGRMRTWALVEHLGLKDDEDYYKDIPVGAGQTMPRYSPHAVDRLREEAENQELLDEAWAAYRARHGF